MKNHLDTEKVFTTEIHMEYRCKCGNCNYNFPAKLTDFQKEVLCPNCFRWNLVMKVPN